MSGHGLRAGVDCMPAAGEHSSSAATEKTVEFFFQNSQYDFLNTKGIKQDIFPF